MRPSGVVFEVSWVTLPITQCAACSALRAELSVMPSTRGTTHGGGVSAASAVAAKAATWAWEVEREYTKLSRSEPVSGMSRAYCRPSVLVSSRYSRSGMFLNVSEPVGEAGSLSAWARLRRTSTVAGPFGAFGTVKPVPSTCQVPPSHGKANAGGPPLKLFWYTTSMWCDLPSVLV